MQNRYGQASGIAEVMENLAGASCCVANDLPAPVRQDDPAVGSERVAFDFVGCAAFRGVVVLPSVAEDSDFLLRPGKVDDGDGAGATIGGAAVPPGVLGMAARRVSVNQGNGEAALDGGPGQAGEPVGERGNPCAFCDRRVGETAQEAGGDMAVEQVCFLLVAVGTERTLSLSYRCSILAR